MVHSGESQKDQTAKKDVNRKGWAREIPEENMTLQNWTRVIFWQRMAAFLSNELSCLVGWTQHPSCSMVAARCS